MQIRYASVWFLTLYTVVTAYGQVTVSTGTSSAFDGSAFNDTSFPSPQGLRQPYDTSANFAFSGNGFAQPAVTFNTIAGNLEIHQPQLLNDGLYGNGASWIPASANSWLKIDLGQVVAIDEVTFGRDRLGNFEDREPGQIILSFALIDDVYASGDASNDGREYTTIVNTESIGYNGYPYSGFVIGSETISISLGEPIEARYVKLQFQLDGVAVDEVEVFGSVVPEPSTYALMVLGLLALGLVSRRR